MLTQDEYVRCAQIVEEGDPERFRAMMIMPLATRQRIAPVLAFNISIARITWSPSEPMIREMRLKWWDDVLFQIAQGTAPPPHEVATPLGKTLNAHAAGALRAIIAARHWDIYDKTFTDWPGLYDHLEKVTGSLCVAFASLLAPQDDHSEKARKFGQAYGMALWFSSVAALTAHGKTPLPQTDHTQIAHEARAALQLYERTLKAFSYDKALRSFFIALSFDAAPRLRMAAKHPQKILDGSLILPPWSQSMALARAAFWKA